jgi:CDP-glucose 4,6-dehydratase
VGITVDFDIYKGKKVFLTGHTGFKGSWLALWLTNLGAEVCGYSLAPDTEPALFNILGLDKKVKKHILGDVRDFENLKKSVGSFKPDIIFHLAAQPLVRVSYKTPLETYQTNVMGVVNVLEAARMSGGVEAIVNVTTDKCYHNKEENYAYKETDPMGGYDPYSNSKACSELVTSSFRSSFFNPAHIGVKHNTALASARAGNVIGGGDYSLDRLIPDFIKAIYSGEKIVLRNPDAVRPWQFVLEPLSGYLLLGVKLLSKDRNSAAKYASAYNFGPYESSVITVENVVKEAIKILKKGSYSIDKGEHPHEAGLLQLCIEKADKELNWEPIYTVTKAIDETMKWYKAYNDGEDMLKFSNKQINEYAEQISFGTGS